MKTYVFEQKSFEHTSFENTAVENVCYTNIEQTLTSKRLSKNWPFRFINRLTCWRSPTRSLSWESRRILEEFSPKGEARRRRRRFHNAGRRNRCDENSPENRPETLSIKFRVKHNKDDYGKPRNIKDLKGSRKC